ncbi:MAG: hypothetical protein IRY95_05200 [Clostridia bacterium]|nr:hypothetical protein [Clostridia bacterium]
MAKVAVKRGWGCALCGRLEEEKEPAVDVRLEVEIEGEKAWLVFHVCEGCQAHVEEHGPEAALRLGSRLRKLTESAVAWAAWSGEDSPYWEWNESE